MIACRTSLIEYVVWLFTYARLRQRETLVHVAMKQTQHVTTINKAIVFHSHIARRDWQQGPQSLLKRRVHSVNCIVFDCVNVLRMRLHLEKDNL